MTARTSIRPAGLADAAPLADVHVRSWQAAYPEIIPEAILARLSPVGRARVWERILAERASTGVRVWVVERDGVVVGFATTGPCRDPDARALAELHGMYLAPEEWGTGLAAALMARAMRDLRSRGAPQATLWVLEGNRRARRFYERFGWRLDGARKMLRIGGYPVAEVRYRIDLT